MCLHETPGLKFLYHISSNQCVLEELHIKTLTESGRKWKLAILLNGNLQPTCFAEFQGFPQVYSDVAVLSVLQHS